MIRSSLLEITSNFKNGELQIQAAQVRQMIRALFSNTDHRQEALAKIHDTKSSDNSRTRGLSGKLWILQFQSDQTSLWISPLPDSYYYYCRSLPSSQATLSLVHSFSCSTLIHSKWWLTLSHFRLKISLFRENDFNIMADSRSQPLDVRLKLLEQFILNPSKHQGSV